ncbi:MAG: phosphatidylinositol mannoside acyltransferase [Streptosporangiaceae bacterium]|nr:phosphatidylinositol mannoside acyltransferase [Streptosporangiaceae bacterium]
MRERLISAAFALGWTVIRRMPEPWARAAFTAGAEIAWRRQGHRVQVLEGNLRRVLGPDAGGKELRKLSRAAIRSYARYYLEAFRLQDIPRERILDGMHSEGPGEETAFRHMKAGRGVIFALPHMGNFEQAGAWIIARGAGSFTTVAERLRPDSVYERFLDFREGIGMEVLPATGGPHPFGVLAQRLRAGKLVCLVSDRDLTDSGVEVEFFGEKARMAAGPAALAVQTGAALMPVSCWFDGDADWGAHIHDEIPVPAEGDRKQKVQQMIQQLARVFERAITEHPADWHMLQRVFTADLDLDRLRHEDPDRPRSEEPDRPRSDP